MTPHEALESLYRIEKNLGTEVYEAFDQNGWELTRLLLELQPVHFHFGDITPQNAHLDFANQLLENKVFKLPFPYIFITNTNSPHSALLVYQETDSGVGDTDYVTIITLGPFYVGGVGSIVGSDGVDKNKANYSDSASPLLLTFHHSSNDSEIRWRSLTHKGTQYNSRGDLISSEESLSRLSRNSFNLMCGYVAMLMSKEINQQIFPVPERLNNRRSKKKKPLIGERRVITIRSTNSNIKGVKDLIAGRKSPIMHWRRGHVRRLGDRIIPIAPMIVNAHDKSIPEPKIYKVMPG